MATEVYNDTSGIPCDFTYYFDSNHTGTMSDPCHDNWEGVVCSCKISTKCLIYELTLSSHNISGMLPSQMTNLLHLQHLDISDNIISGTFPAFWWQFSELQTLKLNNNHISGSIPNNIVGNSLISRSNFSYFNVGYNELSGRLPESLQNLHNMMYFVVSGNQLSGSLPNFYDSWPLLINFDVSDNFLSSTLPESTLIRTLSFLDVHNNMFTGTIPYNYTINFPQLVALSVNMNQLSGPSRLVEFASGSVRKILKSFACSESF